MANKGNLFFIFISLAILIIHSEEICAQSSDQLIDHADVIQNLNENTLQKGKDFYNQVCAACHGIDGTSSLPRAGSFNRDEFRYGNDPYSMWQTITNGAGQMGAQRWLSPEDRYAVIQYIREEFVKNENPQAYFEITDDYLESLPKPTVSEAEQKIEIRENALAGSQEYGQEYFRHEPGDYGKAIYSSLKDRSNAALIVELTENIRIAYDLLRMSSITAWMGYLDLSDTKYQLYRGEGEPDIDGLVLTGFDRMQWSYQDRFSQLDNLVSDRTPLPKKWLDFHGHYLYNNHVILSYSIIGRKILEMPSAVLLYGNPVIQHTLKIEPGDSWRKLELISPSDSQVDKHGVLSITDIDSDEGLQSHDWSNPEQSLIITAFGETDTVKSFVAAGIQGDTEGMRWDMNQRRQLSLYIPPSDRSQTIRLHRYGGDEISQLHHFAEYLSDEQQRSLPDLETYLNGGDETWNEWVVTQGVPDVGRPRYDPIHYGEQNPAAPEYLVTIPDNYPYVVDRITLPFDNPWGSWIRPTGFDFFEDGRMVMSTYAGDVWLADGIDQSLNQIRWKRIATGLYDPFGVKIVDGKIYVICRDRIMRLNDLNGNGETDFYESFFADIDVSNVPVQAYNFSLQTDSQGNFLYAKAGQYTNNSDPGNVIRVSPDGNQYESIAIGFRAPNGVTVGPDDRIYVSDNEGNWMPANKISIVKEGGFYGYLPTLRSSSWAPGEPRYRTQNELARYPENMDILPDTFDQPIIWMPQSFDNSPGEGTWTPEEWGPLGNHLIHTSFGKGWVYKVMMHEVEEVTQAAVAALPFQFDSGTQRARVNPADGQLYIAGITGWDDAFAKTYGSLDRIRYTGGEGFIINHVEVKSNGIEITFNQKLNYELATQRDQYQIEQWNYRWQERYGSSHWSVLNPDEEGQDTVQIQKAEVTNSGKTVLLNISEHEFQPVDQMQIQLSLESEDGQFYKDTIYLTIHKIPDN
jgi:cytochrome c5